MCQDGMVFTHLIWGMGYQPRTIISTDDDLFRKRLQLGTFAVARWCDLGWLVAYNSDLNPTTMARWHTLI